MDNQIKNISKVIILTVYEDGTSDYKETNFSYSDPTKEEEVSLCPECNINLELITNEKCSALYCPSGLAGIIS